MLPDFVESEEVPPAWKEMIRQIIAKRDAATIEDGKAKRYNSSCYYLAGRRRRRRRREKERREA